eukprot:CAMPEP_0117677960 /NCGR_PEP_ID=MMETSP0804-20121206/17022_1 /TAXON_ID=1074897 /ORGANISM="Tetraselmis astigmatica, Strain CCMP880" /LENGTH=439 /DNA_ID=CAMNT_0005487275 /DNA_START=437 /DNA_END=1756 /DNA_ORIENTATION=+
MSVQCSPGYGELLEQTEEILANARKQFLQSTSHDRPDSEIDLAKCCLTIALEEEAAAQLLNDELKEIFGDVIEKVDDLGGVTTWSLKRIDMLAAEAMVLFQEYLAAADMGTMEEIEARIDALDAADRVDLRNVLYLKPKPKRVPGIAEEPLEEASQSAKTRVELFPLLMISAINEVLYIRHGYRRSQHHGEPRESQITTVLEYGEGSPVAMGILYQEICKRVGLPVAGMPIDDDYGLYYILWPTKFPLKVGNIEYVVDPYGNGDLLPSSEVCEMFGLVDAPYKKAIRPATNRQILAALLSHMRKSYWASAVGCSPEPAFIQPLDSKTVSAYWWGDSSDVEANWDLQRALACVERQLHLTPGCQKTQLQYALLQYAYGDYETAWQEFGLYLERGGGSVRDDDQNVRVLMERLRMFLEFDVTWRSTGDSLFSDLGNCDVDM